MTPTGLLITLVALVIVSMFRGWLSPKPHVDFLTKRIETQQETIDVLTATNGVQARTIDKQTAVGETVVRVMSAVQEAHAEGETK
jgi:hypothetical protein